MRKRVLHIHVTNLKYRSAGGSRQWHVHILLPLCFKPRFVKYFAMFFGYITWFYGLPVSATNDRFSHDFAQYLSLLAVIYI